MAVGETICPACLNYLLLIFHLPVFVIPSFSGRSNAKIFPPHSISTHTERDEYANKQKKCSAFMLLPPWFGSYVRRLAINKSGCVPCVIVIVQGVRNHVCGFWHMVKSTGLLLKVYFHWLLIQVTTGGKDQHAWISISLVYKK